MAAAEKGFDFDSGSMMMNDFSHADVDDDGDCEISMDFDCFFDILNEDDENSDPLPTGLFYPTTDNSQDCGSSAHVGNREDFLLHQYHGAVGENSAQTVEALEQLPSTSPAEIVLTEANYLSLNNSSTESHVCQLPNFEETNYFPSTQDGFNEFNVSAGFPDQNLLDGANYDSMLTNGQMMSNMKGYVDDLWLPHSWLENKIALGDANTTASQVPYDFLGVKGPELMLNGSQSVTTYDSSSSTTTDEASAEPFIWRRMDMTCEKKAVDVKGERSDEILEGFERKFSETNKEGAFRGFSFAPGDSVQYHIPAIDRRSTNQLLLEKPVSSAMIVPSFGNSYFKKEGEDTMVQVVSVKSDAYKGTQKANLASLSNDGNEEEEEDDDICIIDDMNQPGRIYRSSNHAMSPFTSHCSTFTPKCPTVVTPFPPMGGSGTRLKATDERLIFQALVQDLSQSKSEATPPDGSLTVPLLRHQRIALSWMVQKETTSLQCSGGILADDQGLGKTVSTIALILTERPSSSRTSKEKDVLELETLDLDEDADKQARTGISVNDMETSSSRGRPSGGTLIVCPTSVLRQWAEELHNKVTNGTNLSVLVYHGSNRTKDPYEVAKYDAVITTYSIVSMEVPKQPVVVKGGHEKCKPESDDASSILSSKKRKHSSTSDKKRSKRGMDNELIESAARPLARVSWFRVVLDEAQSIKNFRTQVAQACWGLRAKRRWCLSGTPIQNAVDDLYSYFRFLKYDPYSVYNSFCSMVKVPITRNPASGYRKLQAVLKTIMLRRTKGTLLDGKPIINLPPKSVKLMKVEFSEDERYFYSRLEADSRAQFQAYAESGTVKQNYVNILLLLLQLRQACDHPLLVQGYDSSSVLKSSIHMAKKLSQEQQARLLNCLEASLAICHICRDPPEDAVVSICGHVFCNQCISERLSGDDYQCPATKCKAQLSGSSVFSKATLKTGLSAQPCQDGSYICSASDSSDQTESVEPRLSDHFDSSKLKAALEILQSLSTPQVSVSNNFCEEPDIKNSYASTGPGKTNSVVKEKAIVFSQWTRMLDLLEACLKDSSIQYRRLDGTMSVVARDKAVRDFNTLPEVSVMIMSLKAASLGLNMVAACHVLLLDLWWNPTTEDQAIDRAHRIGQTRPVTVVRLTVKDTVEDRILALQQKKRQLVASAFGEDETRSRQSRLTVDDLKYLFMA